MSKTALIVGATGQDGSYLSKYLLEQGYRVVGTSRDSHIADRSRLIKLGIDSDVELLSLIPSDFRSVLNGVRAIEPNEIYNLSGQTSVGLSFDLPVESIDSILTATTNFLEVLRFFGGDIRFFSAGSSECFGNTGNKPATEISSMQPRSPYAVAKSAAFWLVSTYREAYGLYACTGLLANHESPLRPSRFVTQKIIQGVHDIKLGKKDYLELGNLSVSRDWGWAPDYVKAMSTMLQSKVPKDYIIASGRTYSLYDFVREAFSVAELDIDQYLRLSDSLKRPSDVNYSSLSPERIKTDLGWETTVGLSKIVYKMFFNELI